MDFIAIHGWGGQWTMVTRMMLRVLHIEHIEEFYWASRGEKLNKITLNWRRFDDTISIVFFIFLISIIKIARKISI